MEKQPNLAPRKAKARIICFTWYFTAAALVLLQGCKDDDPQPTSKAPILLSYESVYGHATSSVIYEYDEENKVAAIAWSRTGDTESTGSESFVYDDEGRLKEQRRYVTGVYREKIVYTWNEDGIAIASRYNSDNKRLASTYYEYNEDGQIQRAETDTAEGSVGFLRTDSLAFTYHADGNLSQLLHYSWAEEHKKLMLVSTKTFTGYVASANPVAMIEILPNLKLQTKLPTHYELDWGDGSISYTIDYVLRPDGYPSERTITAPGIEKERTTYRYKE